MNIRQLPENASVTYLSPFSSHNLFSLLLAGTAMEQEAKGFGNVGLFLAVKKQRNLERNTTHETAVTSYVIRWRTIKQLT